MRRDNTITKGVHKSRRNPTPPEDLKLEGVQNLTQLILLHRYVKLIPSITQLSSHEVFIFQQNDALCHTAKATKNWVENKGINVLS